MAKRAKRNRSTKMDNNLKTKDFQPLTPTQEDVFEYFNDQPNLVLHGTAGTGKTFCAIYLALKEIEDPDTPYRKLIIVRSAVPTRDQGFLPGSLDEKMAVYEAPYAAMINEIYGRGDAYPLVKQKRQIEILSTSFLRGITIDEAIIVVDEVQNLTYHEINSIVTRMGINARIIFCGDDVQNDLVVKHREHSGFNQLMAVADKIGNQWIDTFEFNRDDIVRNAFVREFIIAEEEVGR